MTKLTNRQIVALEFAYYRRNRAIKSGEKKTGHATCTELRRMGYLAKQYENSDFYYITPAGLAYLESEYPLVNQPQPAPEVEPLKVGDTVTFHDGFERLTGIIEFARGEWIEILWNGGLKRRNVSDVRKVGK